MTDVIVQKEFVDMVLLLFIGVCIILVTILGAWGYDWFKRTPPASKLIKKATNKKRGISLTQGDQGHVKLRMGFKVRPEGIVETEPENPKPKRSWIGLFARKVNVTKIDSVNQAMTNGGSPEAEKISDELRTQIAQFFSDEATTPTILDGSGVPITFGYEGKGILTRIGHLAALKGLEKAKDIFPNALINVDFTTLKALFEQPWDEAQIDAEGQYKYNEGFAAGRRGEDRNRELKIIAMMFIVAFGLLAAAALIWKFL